MWLTLMTFDLLMILAILPPGNLLNLVLEGLFSHQQVNY